MSFTDNDSESNSFYIGEQDDLSDISVDKSESISLDTGSNNDKSSIVNLKRKIEIISNTNTYNNYYKNSKQSSPYLTKYEKAKLLGVRAQMLASGCPAMVNVPKNIIDTYKIALLEFEEDKIPLMIRRFLPNGNFEDWRLEDMVLK
jgi:DNA-directed RNA polymerases I, II, and III subunit RPABC2